MRIGPQSECQVAVAAVVVAGLIRVVSPEFSGRQRWKSDQEFLISLFFFPLLFHWAREEERAKENEESVDFLFFPLAFSLGTRRGES